MTVYQLMNEELQVIIKLTRNQLIKPDIINQITIYDTFYQMSGKKNERYKRVAELYKYHPDTIKKIILKLNKKIK